MKIVGNVKIAGVPGVTEELFEARQAAIANEKMKAKEAPMLYSCGICDKSYRSSKAHEQHLKSKSHISKASSQGVSNGEEDKAILKKLPPRLRVEKKNDPDLLKGSIEEEESEESEDEWVEMGSDEELNDDEDMDENESGSGEDMDEDEIEFELDPTCCLMCDRKHKTIEKCMVHMHKHHGFFIPDIEYLKDPKGFLTYVGLKVCCLHFSPLCSRS